MKKLAKISLMLSLTTLILPSLVQASDEERAIVPKKGASVAPKKTGGALASLLASAPSSSAVVYSTEGREKGTPSRGTRSITLASGDDVHGVGVATSDRTPVRDLSDPIPPKESRGQILFNSLQDAELASRLLPRLAGDANYVPAQVYAFNYEGDTLSVTGNMPSSDGTGTACIFSEIDLNKNSEIYAQPTGSFPLVMITTGHNQGALYAYVKPFAGIYRGATIPVDGLLPYAYFGGANEGSMRNAREAFNDRMESEGGLLLPDTGIDRDHVRATTDLWNADTAAYTGLGENRPPFLIGQNPFFLNGEEPRVKISDGDLAGLTFPVYEGAPAQEIPGLIVPTEVQEAFGKSHHSFDILQIDARGRVTRELNRSALETIVEALRNAGVDDRQAALTDLSFSTVPLVLEKMSGGYKLVARNDLIPAYVPGFTGKNLTSVDRAFVAVKGIVGSGQELSSPKMLAYLRNQGTHFLLGGEGNDPRTDLYYSLESTHTSYTRTISGEMKASKVDVVPMTYGITSEATNAQRALLNSPTVRVALKSVGVDLTKQLVRDARVMRILTGDLDEIERSLGRMELGEGSLSEAQALKTVAKKGAKLAAVASSEPKKGSALAGLLSSASTTGNPTLPQSKKGSALAGLLSSQTKKAPSVETKKSVALLPSSGEEVTPSKKGSALAGLLGSAAPSTKTKVSATRATPKFSGGREAFDGFIRAENQDPEFLNGDGQYVWKIPQHLISPETRAAVAEQIKDGYFTIIGDYGDIESAFEMLGVN